MQKTKSFFKTAIMLVLACCAIVYAQSIKNAIVEAVYICLESIIPSLYFFMIIASLLMRSGIGNVFQKYLTRFTKPIFGFDGEILAVFMFSQIGGYPVGARLLSDLYNQKVITQKQARIFSCFCYSSGPAFILGMVPDKAQFVPILLSSVLSNLILALILCRLNINAIKSDTSEKLKPQSKSYAGTSIVECTQSCAISLFCVCAMILLMRALISVAQNIGLLSVLCKASACLFDFDYAEFYSFWQSFFEISAVDYVSLASVRAALLAFGGVCVIMQIYSLCNFKISFVKFFLARVLAAIISGCICSLLYKQTFEIDSISVMSRAHCAKFSINSVYSLLLLIMSCILLTKNSRQTKNNVI